MIDSRECSKFYTKKSSLVGKIENFGSVKESLQDLFTNTLEFARIYVWGTPSFVIFHLFQS